MAGRHDKLDKSDPFQRPTLYELTPTMLPDAEYIAYDKRVREAEQRASEAELALQTVQQTALVEDESGYYYDVFHLTRTGITSDAAVTQEQWRALGSRLRTIETSVSWWLGDWAEYANRVWKTSYEQIAAEFGYDGDSLKVYASVCRAIHISLRNAEVSFSHHRLLQGLNENEIVAWLARCVESGWTVKDLQKALSPAAGARSVIDEHFTYCRRVLKRVSKKNDWTRTERAQIADLYEDLARQIREG